MFVPGFRKYVCVLTAIVLLSGPLMACTLPGAAMSEEEKECCRHMADQCGSSQMEDSHSCCKKTPTVHDSTLQLTPRFSPVLPDVISDVQANPLPTMATFAFLSAMASAKRCESPPGHNSVLRI